MDVNTEDKQVVAFLTRLWGGSTATAFIGVKYPEKPKEQQFRNIAVQSVEHAIQVSRGVVAEGRDAYMSCAQFFNHNDRTAANAAFANAFWVDLDCGEEKVKAGKGYATKREAKAALLDFTRQTSLPRPGAIIDSGNGLHVYWFSSESIPARAWKEQAEKLKALTHHYGLLADDSRTADMASVLRIPGSFNFKNPKAPKPVKLRYLAPEEVNCAE